MPKKTKNSKETASLRRRAEDCWEERQTEPARPPCDAEAKRLIHELEVHQIELELQNAELVHAQGAIEAALGRITDLFDFAPVGYLTVDQEGCVCEANLAAAEILGAGRADLIGKPLRIYVCPSDRVFFGAFVKRAFSSQVRERCELSLVATGQKPTVVQLEAVLAEPKRTCKVALIDLTERKRTEEALRAGEAKFAKIFHSSPVAICISSLESGTIFEVNEAFLRFSGYTAEEVIGKSWFETGAIGPEVRQQVINRLQTEGRFVGIELTFTAKGGRRVECIYGGEVVEIEGQRRLLSILLDVTESHRLGAQLRQAQKLEAVGLLAGGAAHDFNNVLAAILLQLGLLREDSRLDAQNLSILQELEREVTRAAGLTRQLLTFSRRQVMQIQLLDLNALVTNLLEMLRRLVGESIALNWQGMENLPVVEADAGMIEQVVVNLCVNARDAMPSGGEIAIETMAVMFDSAIGQTNPEARAGRFVRLSVGDTGCGIDEATRLHLFEPFYTTKELGKGTGLGLATVHGIVKQHSGWIEVETAAGHGSTFHVFLPARREATPAQDRASTPRSLPRGNGETVLVVEDEEPVRRLLIMTLRRFGYQVIEACSGPDALLQWEKHGPTIDLVLTDMVMPEGISGAELVARLRTERRDLRAIIASGYSHEQATGSRSAVPFLSKPFDVGTLLATIRKCIDGPIAEI